MPMGCPKDWLHHDSMAMPLDQGKETAHPIRTVRVGCSY